MNEWTKTFEGWRKLLRKIITKDIPDEDIEWMAQEIATSEHGLPSNLEMDDAPAAGGNIFDRWE